MKVKKNKQSNFFSSGGGPRSLFIGTLVLFGLLVILHQLTEYTRGIDHIFYSAFLKQIEDGQVKKVVFSGQEGYGTLANGAKFTVTVGNDQGIWSLLRKHNVEFGVENSANQFNWWYLLPLLSLMIMGVLIWYFLRKTRSSNGMGGGNIFTMGKSRAKMFMPTTIKEKFESVAGAQEAKEELSDIVDFLKNPEKYRRLGAKMTRGVLLIGAPGNGKTLLARAVAGEANCPFFSASGSEFIEVFVGVGSARVRDLFKRAREHAPSIVFIDEIDAIGGKRGNGFGGSHEEKEQTLNQLLTEMDGFQTHDSSVIVLAATNRPDVLDEALLRPGRFDRRVRVPYPDLKSREQILKVHADTIKLQIGVDLGLIARRTAGFSGADLANLINEAAILASKNNSEQVTAHDINEAQDKINLGKEIKTILLTDEDRRIIAYHESGHALIPILFPDNADPVDKITIIPRSSGALGVTHFLPRERYIRTKEDFTALITSAAGGRAAEALVFNKATTGPCNDFQKASQLAREMVCLHGMSEEVGHVQYQQGNGYFQYSQDTAQKIDSEVTRIVNECYEKALEILSINRDKLDLLANSLLEKETIYMPEIYGLLGIAEPKLEHQFL